MKFKNKNAIILLLFHIIAAIVNLVLRFSWAANRFEIFATLHPSHLILFIEVAEVFRRAMWNIFRIEWEIIVKQNILTVAKNTDEYSDQDDMIALIDRSQGKISPHKESIKKSIEIIMPLGIDFWKILMDFRCKNGAKLPPRTS